VDIDLNIKVGDEDIEQGHLVNVRMQTICWIGKYEYCAEEVDQHSVHYGIAIQALLNVGISTSKDSKKLHDKLFELKVIEYWRVFGVVKHKGEISIVDNLLYFIYVLLVITVIDFKAELQILIVKNSNIGLYVVLEYFYDSRWLKQIVVEERRQYRSVYE
jgi:hypothetical protein